MRTEREYIIKIIDYKGKITGLKVPKKKREKIKLFIDLLRLYERAKKYHFLTKSLFLALKSLATALKKKGYHFVLIKYPALLRHYNELMEKEPEDLEEEVVYGKIREHGREICHVCGTSLVYPAYIVFKKDGKEIKRSESIGIKCLNNIEKNITDLVEKLEVNTHAIKEIQKEERKKIKEENKETCNNYTAEEPRTLKYHQQSFQNYESQNRKISYHEMGMFASL